MADDVRETNGLGINVGLASDLVHIIPHCCRVSKVGFADSLQVVAGRCTHVEHARVPRLADPPVDGSRG